MGLVGGIFLASAALLLGLFLYQMWKGPADWPLLFTGLFALFSCIARIAYLYTHSVTPGAAWFFSNAAPPASCVAAVVPLHGQVPPGGAGCCPPR